jgi:MFS family permease
MTQTATVWLVYHLTKSPFWLGCVAFLSQAPSLLVGPFAGVWVDRLPRLPLLRVTQFLSMLQSFALAWLTLSHQIQLRHLLLLATAQGVVNAFDLPARQALVGLLAEKKEDLAGIIGMNVGMFHLSRLIGPAIAGFVIEAYGSGGCFLIDGISYLAVLLALLLMRLPSKEIASGPASLWGEMRAGFQYAFGFHPIRTLITLTGCLSLLGISYTVLIPVYAREIFAGDARTLGFLMSSSAVGSVLAALYLTSRPDLRGLGRVICLGSTIAGAALAVFAFSRYLPLSLLCLVLAGMGSVLTLASNNTLVQNLVDEDKRGRVMGLYGMAFMGGLPIGCFLVGALAEKFGPGPVVCGNALACWLLAWWFAGQLPRLRTEARPVLEKAGLIDPKVVPLG